MFDAIAKGIGAILNHNATKDANAMAQYNADRNINLQREFAQSGIQWKVADAEAAGIHPLFALGANTHSFSPVSVGTTANTAIGDAVSGMGQDITRAVNATRSGEARDTAFTKTVQALGIEKAQLENEVLKASLASSVQRLKQQANPPMPTGRPVPEDKKYEERPKLIYGGVPIKTDPGSVNAETTEKRYGDIAQEISGIFNMWRDYRATTAGKQFPFEVHQVPKSERSWWPKIQFKKGGD